MNPPLHRLLIFTSVSCGILASPLAAQPPGKGPGNGGGGFQEAIHTLFENHAKIRRTVELTETGYRSRTVSDDPVIAKTLRKHVREMRDRLGSGMMIRRWDPAFAELVEHYQEIDHEFKEVEGGVEMIASGKTPEAIKVTQNHARIISAFVREGPAQMHQPHPRALDGGKTESTDEAAPPAGPPKATAPAAAHECPKCSACPVEEPKIKPGCPACVRDKNAGTPANGKADPPKP